MCELREMRVVENVAATRIFDKTRRVRALALVTTLLAISANAAERRGAFAFHYGPPLTPRQLRWFARFDVVVTHDPLPRAQVDALHARGTKLLVYEWSVAFYGSLANGWQRAPLRQNPPAPPPPLPTKLLVYEWSVAFYGSLANAWQRALLQQHPDALLNRAGLRGGAGSADAEAWYYDPASDEHRAGRARAIARRLDDVGYDGVFLDTTTEASVHPAALAEFRARHRGADYDHEFARFLGNLRRELHGKLIFTNQGYRKADDYLPYADWDLTESLITWKGGVPRPWDDPRDPWNSIRYLFVHAIAPARARYPHVRFAHLNYGGADVVPLVVATAKLFGDAGFVADRESPLYFADLGAPRTARVDEEGASYRLFERGVVAVNASTRPLRAGGRVVPACAKRCPVAVVERR